MTTRDITQRERALGIRLRNIRQAAGLTQQDLGQAAGVDRKTVNRIENGSFSPTLNTLLRLSVSLDTPITRIMRGI